MYRDIKKARTRKEFVTMCINNPKLGAVHLENMASKLAESKTSREIVQNLSNLLYLTERTIYLDCIPENTGNNL